jgi:hypothetical protein
MAPLSWRALIRWGTGKFFKKPAVTFPLINSYRMSLISAGSISLDSTFKEWVQSWYLKVQVCLLFLIFVIIYVEEHARFVILFVWLFVWIITVYLLKLFCSATVPLCDTIVLSRARHIRLTSIDASKWYWDDNSQYRIMTFPKCSSPVCSCIKFLRVK